jgi:DNA polymerase III subunit beta
MMNFTVDRDRLEGLLTRVQSVAERRHTMPVLSHTLLTADASGLTLVASDLEIVIRCVQEADVAESGAVALPARKFFDIAKVLPKGPVRVVEREGHYVEIAAERGNFRLAGLDSREFPEMPEKPGTSTVTVDADTFRKLVERTVAFASSDETRYNLAGILLEQQDGDGTSLMRMVATDGHRMAIAEGEAPGLTGLLAAGKALVPRKGLLEIRKLAESGPGSLEMCASEKFLYAGKGDTELWVRLLEADFPDYRQVIPRDNRIMARVPRDAFVEALRRVSVMAPEKVNSIRLSFTDGQIEVSTTSQDLGEARDVLAAAYEGPPIRIGFNGRYLLDALSGVAEETVVMEMKDDVSQVLMRPEKDTAFTAVIMPMRIF